MIKMIKAKKFISVLVTLAMIFTFLAATPFVSGAEPDEPDIDFPGADAPGVPIISQHGNPFDDVDESAWYFHNVMFVYRNELMAGTSPVTFSPETPVTRGMAVTVLYRMNNDPDVSGLTNPFSDVNEAVWYAKGVKWAAANGIVSGYGDGRFGPEDSVTREQLAVIFQQYMNFTGKILPVTMEYIIFADEDQISGYASGAIQTLYKLGVIGGLGDRTIAPKGDATRAQFAAMLQRLIGRIGMPDASKQEATPTEPAADESVEEEDNDGEADEEGDGDEEDEKDGKV